LFFTLEVAAELVTLDGTGPFVTRVCAEPCSCL
jgi:hypothetical protein